MAVEFFFIISGLLLAQEYDEKRKSILDYVKNRVIRLYPHYIFSFIVFVILTKNAGGWKTGSLSTEISCSILELAMLQIVGIGRFATNHGAVWYVSALFVSSIIIYMFLVKITNRYIRLVLFIVVQAIYFFSRYIFGNICIVTYDTKCGMILLPGLIRGIAEMLIGVGCYYFCKINHDLFARHNELKYVEFFVMLSIILYSYNHFDHQELIILGYALVACLSYGICHDYVGRIHYDKYSYAMYLNHPVVLLLFPDSSLLFVIVVVGVYSIITHHFVNYILKLKEIGS